MKIGFDGKRAAQNRTGLGNYSRLLVRILSQPEHGHDCHLYLPNPKKTTLLQEIPTLNSLHLHFPKTSLWRALRSLWRVWGISSDIKKDTVDIFHGLSNELPLSIRSARCKTVVTIHDLIFLRYPQYYKPIDRWIYNYKFKRACVNADRVIAISEFTKREIIHFYGIDEQKIDVVYQGCDPMFAQDIAPAQLGEVASRYALPPRFLLYVGSIEERKNLMLVAKAMRVMCDRGMKPAELLPIVAVGKRTPYVDELLVYLRDNALEGMIQFYHNLPYTDLPSFYKLATAFVYPSRIEGFGIPMLEAVTSGVPAIGCTGSCLEEAGGPDSLYVDPDDAEAMADAIEKVTDDEAFRMRMIERGKTFAARFNDATLYANMIYIYNKVLG